MAIIDAIPALASFQSNTQDPLVLWNEIIDYFYARSDRNCSEEDKRRFVWNFLKDLVRRTDSDLKTILTETFTIFKEARRLGLTEALHVFLDGYYRYITRNRLLGRESEFPEESFRDLRKLVEEEKAREEANGRETNPRAGARAGKKGTTSAYRLRPGR